MAKDNLNIDRLKMKNIITLIFFGGALLCSFGCYFGSAVVYSYNPDLATGIVGFGVAVCFIAHIYLFMNFKRIKTNYEIK